MRIVQTISVFVALVGSCRAFVPHAKCTTAHLYRNQRIKDSPITNTHGKIGSMTDTVVQWAQGGRGDDDNENGGVASRGPTVNFGLLRQTVINQALIGSTIWTGGIGYQALADHARFGTPALILGLAGAVPLIFFSRFVETNESPAVADLNLSTNMLVLRLFGDKPQPIVALIVSAFLAGLTGLVEETTFRGLVLPTLVNKYNSLPTGFVLSTLLFAALHLNPLPLVKSLGSKEAFQDAATDAGVLIAYQLVTGAGFAMVYLLSGQNLAAPIITHTLFDFYVFFASHLMVTTQMEYARRESLMPVAPRSIEAKWRQQRGEGFLLGAREAFYLADSNRDGVLSREELRIALYSYGMRLTADQSAIVTAAADINQSGKIDFGEFLEFIGPTGSPGKAIKNSLLGASG